MKYGLIRVGLIFSIFLIFISICITPSIIGNIKNITNPSVYDFINFSNAKDFRLTAYWNFDEGTGSLAHDTSGHGFHGFINDASWDTGYSNYSLNFDGEASNINLDLYSEDLGFNKTDDYKISFWIKSESTISSIIYMMSYSSLITPVPIFYIKFNFDGTLQIRVQSTPDCELIINSTNSYNDGLWHFVEGIYFGSDSNPILELYVDSILVGSDFDWLCPMISIQFKKAKIGMSTNDSEFFNGLIDEVKIFKIPGGNKPPNIPICNYDKKNDELTVSSNDTNGDQIRYGVSWNNDQIVDKWTELYDSGVLINIDCEGNKGTIGVVAEDENGAQSEWVSIKPKVISINLTLFLQRLFQRFLIYEKILN
jgi:hypothetical protein